MQFDEQGQPFDLRQVADLARKELNSEPLINNGKHRNVVQDIRQQQQIYQQQQQPSTTTTRPSTNSSIMPSLKLPNFVKCIRSLLRGIGVYILSWIWISKDTKVGDKDANAKQDNSDGEEEETTKELNA